MPAAGDARNASDAARFGGSPDMKKIRSILALAALCLPIGLGAAPAAAAATTCSRVDQYGVAFIFDRAYTCGHFANGDTWVVPATAGGTVKITSMVPAFTGTQNGFQVNPTDIVHQGFDSTATAFDARLVPALPYLAKAGQSIVKAVSLHHDPGPSLGTAAVLTVLAAVPANNGATVFRPPYFGTAKPLYSTTTLHLEKLPHLAPVGQAPALAALQARYQRVQLDHQTDWDGEWIHPSQNMPFYGADVAIDNTVVALRLMLNDANAAKLPLVIDYVQYGIDLAAARRAGLTFEALGGHRHGRKLVLALTAVLLNDAGIRALVHDAPYNTYQEDGQLYYSAKAKMVLWGSPATSSAGCTAADYWFNQNTGTGSVDCRDPYGYIDGGQTPGEEYQLCCTSMAYKAIALALRLMPELQCVWNDKDILAYADRWVSFGAWTRPDPYAPHGNGRPGAGRYPQLHGSNRNGGPGSLGWYDDPFAEAMWTAYRAKAPPDPVCK
jgi:hypothetical protein